jgi:hypothetical protein
MRVMLMTGFMAESSFTISHGPCATEPKFAMIDEQPAPAILALNPFLGLRPDRCNALALL